MEHRYSERSAADSKLLIYKRGVPVALGVLQNVSRNGMFVRTDYCDLDLHQYIEIELLPHRGNGTGCCTGGVRLQSFVVHRGGGGFGVEIDDSSGA